MSTEDLGDQFLLILCFIPKNRQIIIRSCFIPISKKYRSCYVEKSIVLVTFQKASTLFCSKMYRSFIAAASLWFV